MKKTIIIAIDVDDENWLYILSLPYTCFTHNVFLHAFLPAAVPSVVVSFNDTRCATDGGRVCPTNSLLFTCTANEIITLRVALPSGSPLGVFSDGTVTGSLPDGFSVESSSVAVNDGGTSFNYTLSLSIHDVSLLAGSVIACDDNTINNQDIAGCPTAGKFHVHT